MEKVIYDEKNGLWYELQGDYYIPCIKLPEKEQQPIGIWGQRHLRYIKQNRKVLYLKRKYSMTPAAYRKKAQAAGKEAESNDHNTPSDKDGDPIEKKSEEEVI